MTGIEFCQESSGCRVSEQRPESEQHSVLSEYLLLERQVPGWEEGNMSGEQGGEAAAGRGHRGDQSGASWVQLKGRGQQRIKES